MKLAHLILILVLGALPYAAIAKDAFAEFKASVQRATGIKIVTTEQEREHLYASANGIRDGAKLADLLVFQPIQPEAAVSVHKCRGSFAVIFLDGENELGRASYAHGNFDLGLTPESQVALIEFLEAKGLKIRSLIVSSAESPNQHH